MAGHGWGDWFEREEFIGQISDIRVQNLQVEREVVQKRTFTRWMNLHLEKCDPPMEVRDLFRDIQDGRVLMALLEELSGCKLLHGFKKSSHRIFRLNNIAKVLTFLEERNVKLVSIDAADVADGNSSIILGLIWNIILFFQIKELTGNIRSQFPSSSSLSSIPTSSDSDTSYSSTPSEERRPSSGAMRDHGKPIKKLLQWVQKRTRKYSVAVQDFGKSWTSGLAFLAVIKSIDSSLVDMRRAMLRTARENLEDAFRTAHYSLGIPRLLEPEDVTINSPDEQSIMTYVSQFLEHFPGIEEPDEPCQLIEQSISMGRLSSRDSDFDQIRNGIYRSHLRERPYTVRKDWVQPPPKIFISSVSEDRGCTFPTFPSASARPWASEDSLVGCAPVQDRSPSAGDSNSNSPVTESVNSESVIGDSAISSPDSWVESDVGAMQDRFGESRSDSFLCDSGTAWDVGVLSATPEEGTPLDEGLMPSKVARPPNEQSIPELFIDEGIYLSSSLESTQERIQAQSEKEEEKQVKEKEANRYLQDLNQDRAPGQNEAERKVLQKDQVSSERQSSLTDSDATGETNSGVVHSLEPNGTNQSQPSSGLKPLTLCPFEELNGQDCVDSAHRESECAKHTVEFSGDSQVCEGQLTSETKSEINSYEQLEMETGHQKNDSLSEEEREETGMLKERDEEAVENTKTQDTASQGVFKGHTDPQENTDGQIHDAISRFNTHPEHSVAVDQPPTNQDRTSKPSVDPGVDLNVPQTSVPDDSAEKHKERTRGPEREDPAGDEDLGPAGSSGNQGLDVDSRENEAPNEMSLTSSENDANKHPESALCLLGGLLSENVKPKERTREIENGHLDDINQQDTVISSNTDPSGSVAVDNMEISETQQKCGSHHDYSHCDITTTDDTETESLAPPTSTDAVPSDRDTGGNSPDQRNIQDKPGSTFLVDKTAIAQQNRPDPADSQSNDETGTTASEAGDMDLFYPDTDRSSPSEELVSDLVDPMDLFYPDKEESMFPEPPDREVKSQWSVLSVSALQPAPTSETLPEAQPPNHLGGDFRTEDQPPNHLGEDFRTEDQPPNHLGEDFRTEDQPPNHLGEDFRTEDQPPNHLGEDVRTEDQPPNHLGEDFRTEDQPPNHLSEDVRTEDQPPNHLSGVAIQEQEKETPETQPGGDTPSESRDRCPLLGEGAVVGWGVEGSDPSQARDQSPDSARENMEPMRSEAKVSRRPVESLVPAALHHPKVNAQTQRHNSDLGLSEESDLYLLLLLWLLLYCLLLLPQMDLKTLPSLLLNLDP